MHPSVVVIEYAYIPTEAAHSFSLNFGLDVVGFRGWLTGGRSLGELSHVTTTKKYPSLKNKYTDFMQSFKISDAGLL